MEIRSFSSFKKTPSIKKKAIALSTTKRYADLHLLVEGHEFSSYGSRVTGEALAFDEASDIGFVHCQESYPLHLGYHNFAIFFPGEPHQPNGYAGQEEVVRKHLVKILID